MLTSANKKLKKVIHHVINLLKRDKIQNFAKFQVGMIGHCSFLLKNKMDCILMLKS